MWPSLWISGTNSQWLNSASLQFSVNIKFPKIPCSLAVKTHMLYFVLEWWPSCRNFWKLINIEAYTGMWSGLFCHRVYLLMSRNCSVCHMNKILIPTLLSIYLKSTCNPINRDLFKLSEKLLWIYIYGVSMKTNGN